MKNSNQVVIVAVAVAVFALLCSSLAFSQAAAFSVVSVPGSSPDSVIAINNGGVVLLNGNPGGSPEVSIWSQADGAQIVELPATNGSGSAINNSNDVVGAGDPNSSNLQAFVWQPAGGTQWLGSLGGNLSAAYGLNDSGAVVGLSFTSANAQHAFLWTASGGMQDLTPDLTNIGGATATAINSANQVVGYYFPNGSFNTLGFLWTEAGGLQNLGPAGTLAFAVNDAGTVVGQSPVGKGYRHAFSWTQAGGFVDLGTLGGVESSATGINSLGWIVGTSLTTNKNGYLHGYLWTPTAGMQDLNILAHLATENQQTYSLQVNDSGLIAISTNKGCFLLIPQMTTTVTSSANPSVQGQSVTFTATMTSIAGPPPDGETVEFLVDGAVAGSAKLKSGVAKFTTSSMKAGRNTVVATYGGDSNYLPAKHKNFTQVVDQ